MVIQKDKCPVKATLNVVKGKWKTSILYYLMQEPKRFGEIKKLLPNVTQRILALQLQQLERDRLISRTVYAEIPPKVEYSLTSLGQSLIPVLLLMREWGEQYVSTIKNQK